MKKFIIECKGKGYSLDHTYELCAGMVNLYGVAFFGHKYISYEETRKARRKLRRLFLTISKYYTS